MPLLHAIEMMPIMLLSPDAAARYFAIADAIARRAAIFAVFAAALLPDSCCRRLMSLPPPTLFGAMP
jgi:hypothetical protein